ncbi:hypothetical protein G6O67_003609 [Ophiocordyceps sinensis]|uniref:Secreted protein n=1 Tax=Ophiocordyceps sinensis TaxID=72228 RepID=A0A8H4V664_9HYPO|nr:hypothetical protein G6O67_003609 [Ophiocordyceps sinensis]
MKLFSALAALLGCTKALPTEGAQYIGRTLAELTMLCCSTICPRQRSFVRLHHPPRSCPLKFTKLMSRGFPVFHVLTCIVWCEWPGNLGGRASDNLMQKNDLRDASYLLSRRRSSQVLRVKENESRKQS